MRFETSHVVLFYAGPWISFRCFGKRTEIEFGRGAHKARHIHDKCVGD
jgi:hypothetical protein